LIGLNLVGLKRKGFTTDRIRLLKEIYRILLQSNESLDQRVADASVLADEDQDAQHLVDFVAKSTRGLTVHGRD